MSDTFPNSYCGADQPTLPIVNIGDRADCRLISALVQAGFPSGINAFYQDDNSNYDNINL
jgi:hypothetical protein